jgi:thiamine-phosphate pyrophosphorylase
VPFGVPPSRLNVILDWEAATAAGWALPDLADACLRGGARFLQFRAKTLAGAPWLELASVLVRQARAADATLIVNDRADIARLSGAAGVHIGQGDLPPAAVRGIVGPSAILGLSTHSPAQLEGALAKPLNPESRVSPVDYVAIGPVFPTRTKPAGPDPVGLEGVRRAAARAFDAGMPLVAIGGITLERAAAVIEAGAVSVAVITDVLAGGDPEVRVRQYLAMLDA